MTLPSTPEHRSKEAIPAHPRWLFSTQAPLGGIRGKASPGESIEVIASVRATDAVTYADGPVVSRIRLRSIQRTCRSREGASGQFVGVAELIDSTFAGRALQVWASECAARVLVGPDELVIKVRQLLALRRGLHLGSTEPGTWEMHWDAHRHALDSDELRGKDPARLYLDSGHPAHRLAMKVAESARNALRYRTDRAALEDAIEWQESRLVELLEQAFAAKRAAVPS